jgi:hypothetical protein
VQAVSASRNAALYFVGAGAAAEDEGRDAKEWLTSLLSRPESMPVPTSATLSFENAGHANERVFRGEMGVGRGENGCSKTRAEFEGMCEIECDNFWVV